MIMLYATIMTQCVQKAGSERTTVLLRMPCITPSSQLLDLIGFFLYQHYQHGGDLHAYIAHESSI